jgi:hypothetical protein
MARTPSVSPSSMGIGISLLLIATGAALVFATGLGEGFGPTAVGSILLVVGAIGGFLSVLAWATREGSRLRRPPGR